MKKTEARQITELKAEVEELKDSLQGTEWWVDFYIARNKELESLLARTISMVDEYLESDKKFVEEVSNLVGKMEVSK